MGMSDNVIFGRLLLEGWTEERIRHAFIEPPPPAESTLTDAEAADLRKKQPRRFSLATIAIGIVALCGFGVSTYLYLKPPVVYSISIPVAHATSTLAELTYGALPALSDPSYYLSVKEKLIAQKASFLDANLSDMQLIVYVEGELKLQVPIVAKGKVGSWWETPAGIYKIETKEKTHFSSFGQVAMPYSLDFQGNFFIHGWPTYADGTPVSSSYSGGCIRLSTEDAAKVYELSTVGMPVIVYNEERPAEEFNYTLKAPPTVSATEYLIADLDTGAVLTQRNAAVQAPIASITKLVTALVATEYINLDKEVAVPAEAILYTSVPRLRPGENVRAYDLLFLLLQESSNEAAEALAAERGREQFVEYMNKKAEAIGLSRTVFNDPSGARSDMSTPEDLFKLLRYIYDNRRFVFGITTGEITDSAYGSPVFANISNFNIVKNTPAKLLGGKIGQTNEAGETYAGVFSVKVGDTERKLAVIVLDSRDSQTDVAKLLNFVHSSYAPAQ